MLLQDCSCGETLLDDRRKCPRCGQPNPHYRASRWRTFWPDVDSAAGAEEAITLGYWAAFLAAGSGVLIALIPSVGVGKAALVDATLFALCGVGMWRKWRVAAVLAFLLFALNLVFSVASGRGIGVLTVFVFAGLLNGIRGTFGRAKLARAPQAQAVR